MELDPSTGPLPPSWEWKVVGAQVVAQQDITNFIAKDMIQGPLTTGKGEIMQAVQLMPLQMETVRGRKAIYYA
jgi:hypothetical protein